MIAPTPRTSRSRTASALAALAIAVSGCSTPFDEDEPQVEARVLAGAEVRSALLRPRDLGADFRRDRDEHDTKTSAGCLFGQDALRRAGLERWQGVHDAERAFVARGVVGLPAIFESIATMRSSADAAQLMDRIDRLVRPCRRTAITASSQKVVLNVASSKAPATTDVDQQLNVAATGRFPVPGGRTVPFGVWLAFVRVENHVLVLGYLDATSSSGTITRLTSAALARFVPVARGEAPAVPPPLGLSPTRPEAIVASAS